MANEIANIHNDLIDLPLRKFNSSEIDILTTLCYKCKEKKCKEIILKLDDIKKLTHYAAKDNDRFYKDIKSTNKKLMQLDFTIQHNENHFTQFVLFPTFEVDGNKGILRVKVNEEFTYLLNNLENSYTSIELKESSKLKSSYAKGIYKKLRKYRNTDKPFWKVSIEDLKEYLDIPKSYSISNIDRDIIVPALKELSPYFKGLNYVKYYEKTGKGRPKVAGYIFEYRAEPKKEKIKIEPTQESIAKATEWEKTPRYCPKCHRPMYQKQMENENGTYYLYGHTDWKTGECDFHTYDFANLLQSFQLPDEEAETDQQKEQKKKLSDLLSNMFKKI